VSRARVDAAELPGAFALALSPTFFGAPTDGSEGVGGAVVFRIVCVARTPVPLDDMQARGPRSADHGSIGDAAGG
jgi:hypothetical protein